MGFQNFSFSGFSFSGRRPRLAEETAEDLGFREREGRAHGEGAIEQFPRRSVFRKHHGKFRPVEAHLRADALDRKQAVAVVRGVTDLQRGRFAALDRVDDGFEACAGFGASTASTGAPFVRVKTSSSKRPPNTSSQAGLRRKSRPEQPCNERSIW